MLVERSPEQALLDTALADVESLPRRYWWISGMESIERERWIPFPRWRIRTWWGGSMIVVFDSGMGSVHPWLSMRTEGSGVVLSWSYDTYEDTGRQYVRLYMKSRVKPILARSLFGLFGRRHFRWTEWKHLLKRAGIRARAGERVFSTVPLT